MQSTTRARSYGVEIGLTHEAIEPMLGIRQAAGAVCDQRPNAEPACRKNRNSLVKRRGSEDARDATDLVLETIKALGDRLGVAVVPAGFIASGKFLLDEQIAQRSRVQGQRCRVLQEMIGAIGGDVVARGMPAV
jgi:hypothetical protein